MSQLLECAHCDRWIDITDDEGAIECPYCGEQANKIGVDAGN